MPYFILQTALLLLAAYLVGAILGCLMRRVLTRSREEVATDALATDQRQAAVPLRTEPAGDAPPHHRAAPEPVQPRIETVAQHTPPPSEASQASRFERALTSGPSQPAATAAEPAAPTSQTDTVVAKAPAAAETPAPAVTPAPAETAAPVATAPVVVQDTSAPATAPTSTAATAAAAAAAVAAAVAATKAEATTAARETKETRTTVPPAAPVVPSPVAPAPVHPHVIMPVASGTGGVASTSAPIAAPVAPVIANEADDFTRIRSIDAATAATLNFLGFSRFEDIAKLSASDVVLINAAIPGGRVSHEGWIEQARVLASGGSTAYAKAKAGNDQSASGMWGDGAGTAIAPSTPVTIRSSAPAAPSQADAAQTSASTPVSPEPVEDLTLIRAIDQTDMRRLGDGGVTRMAQIAAFTAADVDRFEGLIAAPGRISREGWIEQAQILAKGGETEYARRRRAGGNIVAKPTDALSPLARPLVDNTESKASLRPVGSSAGLDSIDSGANVDADADARRQLREQAVEALSAGADAGSPPKPVGTAASDVQATVSAAVATAVAAAAASPSPVTHSAPAEAESRPASLADAIRANLDKARTVVEPTRSDVGGLRSVRSELLREKASSGGPSEDLKRIRGIGVLIEKKLNSLGITRYEQVANWTAADIDRVSQMLDFKGRIERESWVEQARILASGGQTEFSRRIEKP